MTRAEQRLNRHRRLPWRRRLPAARLDRSGPLSPRLFARVIDAGATSWHIARSGHRQGRGLFRLTSSHGAIRSQDVLVATNGYTGPEALAAATSHPDRQLYGRN